MELIDVSYLVYSSDVMATQAPPESIGVQTNFPGAVPPDVSKSIQSGGPLDSSYNNFKCKITLTIGMSSILQFNTTTQVYNYFKDYKPNKFLLVQNGLCFIMMFFWYNARQCTH
jgi:hypothetical protein